MRLKLPAGLKGDGLHVWCNTCKKVVTKNGCRKVGHSMTYQSRIWNPHLQKVNLIRSWDVNDPNQAFELHRAWKRELVENDYSLNLETPTPKNLNEGIAWYFDYLNDLNVRAYAIKNLSKDYIKEQERIISRLTDIISKSSKIIKGFTLDEDILELFYKYLLKENYSPVTINKHIVGLRSMYKCFITNGFTSDNPFRDMKMETGQLNDEINSGDDLLENDIIFEEELEKLFSVINFNNGFKVVGKERKNFYRPWLKNAILMALYTGERRDGVFLLKWKHVGKDYITIPNFKVRRSRKNKDNHYVPITLDIAEFLLSLERRDDESYIIEPDHENRNTLKNQCSKSFSHFWDIANFEKKKDFKALRKTFETRVWNLLGDKSKALNRHKNLSTTIDHYLNQKAISDQLRDLRLFENLQELNTTT